MPDAWDAVLDELRDRHPFLRRMTIAEGGHLASAEPLPGAVQIAIAIAATMRSLPAPENRAAIVFPRTHDTAAWIAIGTALVAVQRDWRERLQDPLPFRPGQKLYLDDRTSVVVEFDAPPAAGDTHFRVRTDRGYVTVDLRNRFRFKPIYTTTKPVRAATFSKALGQPPAPSVLEDLTGAETSGNDRVVSNGSILITRQVSARRLAESMSLSPGTGSAGSVLDLFLWGSVGTEGDVVPWTEGRAASDPLLVVTHLPDLARAYLAHEERREARPLVVLDGDHAITHAMTIVQELLDRRLPMVVALEEREWTPDIAAFLDLNDFQVWRWTPEDFRSPALVPAGDGESPFAKDAARWAVFAEGSQFTADCRDDGDLSTAATSLVKFRQQLGPDAEQVDPVIRKWYGAMLKLARLIKPVVGVRQPLTAKLDLIEQEVRHQQLTPEARSTAQEVATTLRRAVETFSAGVPKLASFEAALDDFVTRGLTRGAVVLADAQEAEETGQHWAQTVAERWPTLQLMFVGYAAADDLDGLDFLVVSGWLGQERMFRLLNSHIARETVLIAYPFERSWQSAAKRQWQQQRRSSAAGKPRSQLLNVARPELDEPEDAPPVPEQDTEVTADPIEFELNLQRTLRRKRRTLAQTAPGMPGVVTTECRLVWFTDGSHAYLARDRKVLVVSDLSPGNNQSQSLPEREISELRAGDHIAFVEGADSDVVRRQADLGLERAGKAELRDLSGRWRESLRGYLQRSGESLEAVVRALAVRGCSRAPTTVRNWIRTDGTIGPEKDTDLDAIVAVTGDAALLRSLEDVRGAIHQVRSAHFQASAYLRDELLRELPRLLSGNRHEAKRIDIEGLGGLLVVEVAEIDPEPVQVAVTETNRRRHELLE